MKNNKKVINNISFLSSQLLNCSDAFNYDTILKEFSLNTGFLANISLYVFDDSIQRLKSFIKPWQTISSFEHKDLYDKYCLLDLDKYAINSDFYNLSDSDIEMRPDDAVYLLLYRNNIKLGLVKFTVNESLILNANFFNITRDILSLCVTNLTITSKMEANISFYNSMKNIAKIIESQYEPNYVIPIIGEIIDRFLEQHLVYVFLKADNWKLAWPNACKQQTIIDSLNDLSVDNPYFLMNDMKTGVFALISENTILGAVVAYSNIDKLSTLQVDYLTQLSKQAAITLQRAYVYAEILEHATLDALTGLNNRRQFETRLKQEVATAKRKKTDLCAIMIDVDHFKSVNDTYGHLAGDLVLKNVANLVKNELREYDTACRYGGEEFIILLPFTAMNEAFFVAQRLRRAIEETQIDITEAHIENVSSINITISAGVSIFDAMNDNPQSFYQKADAALYDAKNSGRNRVIAYSEN